MTDKEKVIKGLECCGEDAYGCCRECPYNDHRTGTIEYCTSALCVDALKLLKEQPEQKHGHWIPVKESTGVEAFGVKEMTVQSIRCSACNAEEDVSSSVYDYCPWCGAIMDGEVKRNDT